MSGGPSVRHDPSFGSHRYGVDVFCACGWEARFRGQIAASWGWAEHVRLASSAGRSDRRAGVSGDGEAPLAPAGRLDAGPDTKHSHTDGEPVPAPST